MLEFIVEKFSSRKFLLALVQVVAGLLVMFGFSDNTVGLISGALMSTISMLMYIYTEGKLDTTSIGQTIQQIQDAVGSVKDDVKPEVTE